MTKYEVSCPNGHSTQVSPDEMDELLSSHDFKCNECSANLELAGSQECWLECQVCAMTFPFSSLDEGALLRGSECTHCAEYGFGEESILVPHSFALRLAEYKWIQSDKNYIGLARANRTDYWEGVIHFCQLSEFVSIYKQRVILAKPTGYFKRPAVCLTEVPQGNWDEMRERHGAYGYVFHKKTVIAIGGGPACYLSEEVIHAQSAVGFANQLEPFINVLRIPSSTPSKPKHDFLHEREWRVTRDVNLDLSPPYAIVLGDFDRDVWKNRDLLEVAQAFPTLSATPGLSSGGS